MASRNVGVDDRFLADLAAFGDSLRRVLPQRLFRGLRRGLFQEGVAFKKQFRESINSRFKIGRSRVGSLFFLFTKGTKLKGLFLEIFTIWPAAPVYEKGGAISAKGSWLVVPLAKRMFTSGGRIKRKYRDARTGKFDFSSFGKLRPVPVRGGILLVADAGVTRSGRLGKVTKRRGVEATQIVALLIKTTRRKGVLGFHRDFARYFRGPTRFMDEAVASVMRAQAAIRAEGGV